MNFSLYFHNDNDFQKSRDGYKFILDAATYADQNKFKTIWIPERHFDEFGASYPNPAILLAAISSITEEIRLHCGGLLLPLHNPIKVAEDWAMLDILSKQRVGIAFSSGWHVKDYVLAPENFKNKTDILHEYMNTFNRLWMNGEHSGINGNGDCVNVKVYPQPQSDGMPQWLTTVMANDNTWSDAGKLGLNVFTDLLVQSKSELKKGIALYRQTLQEHGHNPECHTVTLLLHTFVGDPDENIIDVVEAPFKKFLLNHLKFFYKYAKANKSNIGFDPDMLSEEDIDMLISMGIKKYFNGQSLIGSFEQVKGYVTQFAVMGVDEIACLIDFGVDKKTIYNRLPNLNKLRQCYE